MFRLREGTMIDNLVIHPRRIAAASVVLALALVASACLAPTQFDPTGRAPIGNLDVVRNAAGGIRVSGWALDPETSAPIKVKVGVAGVVREVTANLSRPDVARAYPGKGSRHGFDYTFGPLDPGLRGICVWVDNTVGRGDDRLLGCDNIQVTDGSPIGNLETVASPSPRSITVSGWAFDPSTSAPAEVAVTVDGQSAARLTANGSRPDVGRVHKRPRSGFLTQIAAVPGRHQVCVGAINVGFGQGRLLGCRNVTVAGSTADHGPNGYLDVVQPTGPDSVLVEGVAQDPDGANGLRVRLDVDPGTPTAKSSVVPVVNGRFSVEVNGLSAGLHTLCPVGLDVDGGRGLRGNRAFICGSAVLGDVAVGTGGAAQNPTWVAPPKDNPLRTTSRDAGVSAQLSDGSTMWFFGDTLEHDRVGDLRYFVNNSAAWAAPGSPTVTRDGVRNGTEPWQFVSPPSDFCEGSSFPNPALWPESAVAVPQTSGPDTGKDKVLVFMSKVCLGNDFLDIEGRGIALAEVTYDPNNKPIDKQIHGDVTALSLFEPAHPYGRAAVLGADNDTLYAYECGRFNPSKPFELRPCTVGRVSFGGRKSAGNWDYWTGSVGDDFTDDTKWLPDATAATRLKSPTGQDVSAPVAAFTLTRDRVHDAYLMVYSPWPGFTDRVEVRVAETPVGPFTDPVTVFLPGCNDKTGGFEYFCYAGTAQPSLSKPGLLGIGYYDQLITPSPKRGQYMAVTVPFRVVITAGP